MAAYRQRHVDKTCARWRAIETDGLRCRTLYKPSTSQAITAISHRRGGGPALELQRLLIPSTTAEAEPTAMFPSTMDDLRQALREYRHNPCIMGPVTAIIVLLILLVGGLGLLLKAPIVLLTLLLSPALGRFNLIIEFLYPTALGRWVHLTLVKLMLKSRVRRPSDKNRGFHSRTIEMRVEIVPGRVYLHPLPQWSDNLGYLIVCVPKPKAAVEIKPTPLGNVTIVDQASDEPLVACVVDCGDAPTVKELLALISQVHYDAKTIEIQSILSTHKHHDHTAGNKGMLKDPELGASIKHVFGGAVEKVPCCNYPLANGECLPLPKSGNNDMNDLVEIEAVATPGHTRGSLVYIMRPKDGVTALVAACLFTGDTMFSGGTGVPFEADIDDDPEAKLTKMTPTSFIRATASLHAVERCFSEVMVRSVRPDLVNQVSSDSILIFAGHEYTSELLARQFTQTMSESCRWKHFTPAVFFETVSHYYVALHRRALPHSSGKLLSAPSTLRRELLINPQLRMLHKRGEIVVRAVQLWHELFAKEKIGYCASEHVKKRRFLARKALSTQSQWNLDGSDVDRPGFATMYQTDLDSIIEELDAGRINGRRAAQRLREARALLNYSTIARRPVPDTLPSDRMIVKGLFGFVLLGSSPTALTLSDSKAMKLPAPVVSSSDRIRISKSRLLTVLHWLGLLSDENDGRRLEAMMDQLWKETREYSEQLSSFDPSGTEKKLYNAVDVEAEVNVEDEVSLGALRWVVYGIPQRPPGWAAKFCMPCTNPQPVGPEQSHPITKCGLRQHNGELVRHDIYTCPLCVSAAGCPVADDNEMEPQYSPGGKKPLQHYCSTQTDDDDGDGQSVSLSPTDEVLNILLREA